MTASSSPAARPEQSERRVEWQRLDGIRHAERNARRHSGKQTLMLAGMIQRFGFTSPCLLDERTGRLVTGHGRAGAVASLRERADSGGIPDGVRVDEDGEWMIPVLRGWSSAGDREAEAMLVADNKASDDATWFNRDLAAILEDLTTDDTTWLDTLGYDGDAVDELLRFADEDTLNGHTADDDDPAPRDLGDDPPPQADDQPPADQATRCPSCGFRFAPAGGR